MRVLCTGGCGFIGSYLVEQLVAEGHEVLVLDAQTHAAVNWDLVKGIAEVRRGDVRRFGVVAQAIGRVHADIVYHLAAQSHVDASLADPWEAFETNAMGTARVAMSCVLANIPMVYCSTDEVYGDLKGTQWESTGAIEGQTPLNPSSPYSAGKAAGEHIVTGLARSKGLRAVITRGCNAFGPRQCPEKLVPIACRLIQRGEPVPLHDGGYQVRQWIHVEDFARCLRSAGAYAQQIYHGCGDVEVFNIAGPIRCSVRTLVSAIAEVSGQVGHGHQIMVPSGSRAGQDMGYHVNGERMNSMLLGYSPERSILNTDEIKGLLFSYPPDGELLLAHAE